MKRRDEYDRPANGLSGGEFFVGEKTDKQREGGRPDSGKEKSGSRVTFCKEKKRRTGKDDLGAGTGGRESGRCVVKGCLEEHSIGYSRPTFIAPGWRIRGRCRGRDGGDEGRGGEWRMRACDEAREGREKDV